MPRSERVKRSESRVPRNDPRVQGMTDRCRRRIRKCRRSGLAIAAEQLSKSHGATRERGATGRYWRTTGECRGVGSRVPENDCKCRGAAGECRRTLGKCRRTSCLLGMREGRGKITSWSVEISPSRALCADTNPSRIPTTTRRLQAKEWLPFGMLRAAH